MTDSTQEGTAAEARASAALVLDLADARPADEPELGGKAASLARMTRAGFPVPGGFCVLAQAYRDHIAAGPAEASIAALLEATGSQDPGDGTLVSALATIRRQIVEAPLSAPLETEVAMNYETLGGKVAVRSSATAEDLPDHSFAGQHGTYFADGGKDCLRHIKHCWASLWTEHAFQYRRARGFDHRSVAMAVVVQHLVEADFAGVIFTADPVSGRTDRVIVEACYGLGEALVSGKISPDRLIFDRDSRRLLEQETSNQTVEVSLAQKDDTRQRPVDATRSSEPCIDEATALELVEMSLEVERATGKPVDVEWASRDGRLHLLQARPITTLSRQDLEPAGNMLPRGSRGATGKETIVWSNANSGEVMPDVASPLTWSIVERWLDVILGTIFAKAGVELGDRPIVGLIAGRAYFNVSLLAAALMKVAPMRSMDLTEILGGMQESDDSIGLSLEPDALPDVGVSRLKIALHMPGFLLWCLAHSPVRGDPFVRQIRRSAEVLQELDTTSLSDTQLAEAILVAMDGIAQYHHSIAFSVVGFSLFTNLTTLCRKWYDDPSLANRLCSGLGGMASAEAGLDMWRLAVLARDSSAVREAVLSEDTFEQIQTRVRRVAGGGRFLDAWDEFMSEHGHHARGELDVMNPRWSEEPDYVLACVRSYVRDFGKMDPVALHNRRAAERKELEETWRRTLRSPFKRAVFGFVAKRAQLGSVIRENTKNEGVRYMAAIRRMLLILGERLAVRGVLASPGDIFFLDLPELGQVSAEEPGFDVQTVIAQRKAEYERNLAIEPPSVVVGRFDPQSSTTPPVPTADLLTGLAVSGGIVTGPARVILRSDTGQQMLPGEILVAPFTDPGWSPYFLPAAGIVMDMGGMLSHGSIVAREYGIAAVVNVGPATKIIKTGQMIEVDGFKGEVRILE